MGLDMYAYRLKAAEGYSLPNTDVKFDLHEHDQFHYWRKHHDLHGWMRKVYECKGGTGPDFNCNSVRLEEEDLDALQVAILERQLPQTQGFFFGSNEPDDESDSDDLKFIQAARDAIREGYAVYYDSWW
ncbi:hypothetical protein UFOVP236_58 [uncultured Caudovirales phage]|uniref:Uncharacterized protein n=1 Tax=uncultured Caudovirales phage TaxID=2100421 RepID=A0A6J7WWD4_9CAUD|nr:hypothetical protein UFOVP236_58 [uncultured Caudovirales phage]